MGEMEKPKRGQPPFAWTPELEAEILTRIMGGEVIAEICGPDRDSFIPSETTFYKHLIQSDTFAEDYARAKEVQAHREFDEIRKIADEAMPESVQVDRLRIDARKWRADKMAPKKYGDKLELDNKHSVSDDMAELLNSVANGSGRIGARSDND